MLSSDYVSALLSETRKIGTSERTLESINAFLEEFLQMSMTQLQTPITPDNYRSQGILRLLPNQLGRSLVLEADIATRKLQRSTDKLTEPSTFDNDDHALSDPHNKLYIELQEWMKEICRIVLPKICRNPQSSTLATVFSTSVNARIVQANVLSNIQARDDSCQALILSSAAACFITCCVLELGTFTVNSLSRTVERESSVIEASPQHLFLTLKENDALWDLLRTMQCRQSIERAAVSRKQSISRSLRNVPLSRPVTANGNTPSRQSSDRTESAGLNRTRTQSSDARSHNAAGSTTFIDLDDEEEEVAFQRQTRESFENLIRSGHTKILTLTPDRFTGSANTPGRSWSSSMNQQARKPRFQARGALKTNDEGSDEDDFIGYGKHTKKESLADLLASEPPWAQGTGQNVPNKMSRMTGEASSTDFSKSLAPSASLSSLPKGTASISYEPLPSRSPARSLSAAETKGRRLQPKNERDVPTGSRELIDFFSKAPASELPNAMHRNPSDATNQQSLEHSRKKSTNRLKAMIGKLGPISSVDLPVEPQSRFGSKTSESSLISASGSMKRHNHLQESPVIRESTPRPDSKVSEAIAPTYTHRQQDREATSSGSSVAMPSNLNGAMHSRNRDVAAQSNANVSSAATANPSRSSSMQSLDAPTKLASKLSSEKQPSSGSAVISHGLPTPEASKEDISALAHGSFRTKVNPLSNQAFMPTPPQSPERIRIKRVPTPSTGDSSISNSVLLSPPAASSGRKEPEIRPGPAKMPGDYNVSKTPDAITTVKPILTRRTYAKSPPSRQLVSPESPELVTEKHASTALARAVTPTTPDLVPSEAKPARQSSRAYSLLLNLREQMSTCQSVVECLALLDMALLDTSEVPSTDFSKNQDRRLSLEQRFVEWFLGGYDQPFEDLYSEESTDSEVSTSELTEELQTPSTPLKRSESFQTALEQPGIAI